jgi:hypothetical protein
MRLFVLRHLQELFGLDVLCGRQHTFGYHEGQNRTLASGMMGDDVEG